MSEPASAGALLFRHLPDEYRFRDRRDDGDPGDLELYLDGLGTLLESLRGAIAQFHADGFADPGADGLAIQNWAIPYLAELIGADLIAPDPEARREELARTVSWHKGKGTLAAADDIADTIAHAETVTVEGWQRTLVTAARPGAAGLPDVRRAARAVRAAGLDDPLHILTIPRRDADGRPGKVSRAYRIANPRGVPCFPGAFDDPAPRLPDMRRRRPRRAPGPHPGRVILHLLPPDGFFPAGLARIQTTDANLPPADAEGRQILSPATLAVKPGAAGGVVAGLDRLTIKRNLAVAAGSRLVLEDVNVDGVVTVQQDGALELRRAAVREVRLIGSASAPALDAAHALIGRLDGKDSFARLENVTVLGDTRLARLQASEALFAGAVTGLTCGEETCIRYSRLPPEMLRAPQWVACRGTNTDAAPAFAVRVLERGGGCVTAEPDWGEPGCGVLAHDAPPALRTGAENEGEIGAYNHLFHAASLRALERRLADALPFGLDLAVAHDARLGVEPPELVGGGEP